MLEALAGEPTPDRVTIKGVEQRLEFARTLDQRTVVAPKDAWDQAIARVAANPKYRGLRLTPELGLIPLGRDPASTLEEFCEIQTGEQPVRDQDGKLQITESTAMVFVLLPGGTFWMGAQSTEPGGHNYGQAWSYEGPVHEVPLDAFFLSKYELTQGQWLRFTGENPSYWLRARPSEITLRHPVEQVSFDDRRIQCQRLGYVLRR
jgi:formylglycine-generating enzyme required for sulfatase activity